MSSISNSNISFSDSAREQPTQPDAGQIWKVNSKYGGRLLLSVVIRTEDNAVICVPVSPEFDKMEQDSGDILIEDPSVDHPLDYSHYLQNWCQFRTDLDNLVHYLGDHPVDIGKLRKSPHSLTTGIDHIDEYRSDRKEEIEEHWETSVLNKEGDELSDDFLEDVAGGLEGENVLDELEDDDV